MNEISYSEYIVWYRIHTCLAIIDQAVNDTHRRYERFGIDYVNGV